MALNPAQESLIDRILEHARRRANRPFVSGDISAKVVRNGEILRIVIGGENPRASANDWVSACAQKAGNARQGPSPDHRLVIDVTLS